MAKKVVKHPTSEQRYREVWRRFSALQDAHRIAERTLWAGTLARNFTAEELSLISGHLCPYDLDMMRQIDANRSRDAGAVTVIPYERPTR